MNDPVYYVPTYGIDVGGSSVKLGIVSHDQVFNYKSFELPVSSTPNNVFAYIRSHLTEESSDTIGIAMPCVVQNGYMRTTANIDDSWQTTNAELVGYQMLEKRCVFINDCDAAALAEMRYGAGRNLDGTVIVVTLGTGIGSALFHDGVLFPNTELGHMPLPGITYDAELYASAKQKTIHNLDWYTYAKRVSEYLNELHRLLWPKSVIIGGGVSGDWDKWGHLINAPCDVYKAELGNNAGIVGAALYANEWNQRIS